MASTPTSRTLAAFRKAGYTVQVVEHYLAFAGVRQDLFGCIDIIAIRTKEILGVQATSTGNISARLKKSLSLPELRAWLEAGGKFCVVGWSKMGKRGKVKHWQMKRVDVTLEMLSSLNISIIVESERFER